MEVAVIGLGKLGLPMAAVYASKGHSIVGIDSNEKTLKALRSHVCLLEELGLADLLSTSWTRCMFTSQYQAVIGSAMTFIVVPTPSDSNGRFINDYLNTALLQLKELDYRQPVVIVSTVMPGSCRQLREKYNLRLIYNPEFIALGSVIQNMLHPDSILIGHEFGDYPNDLIEFHKSIVGPSVPIHVMSWENAELAKLALNCYVTTKITFANQLAEICGNIKGGNVDQVTAFLGSDTRVGKKYLKGGLGFGGPCFPRDNEAFLAHKGFQLQRAVIDYNNSIPLKVLRKALEMVQDIKTPKIAILGTTYKTHTPVNERSQSLQLLRDLREERCDITTAGFDPPEKINLTGYDLAVVCLDYVEFHKLDMANMRHKRVLDCWRIVENKDECELYRAIGVNA